ncbi:MAG: hypothetical protein ACXVPQ_05940 [Bacteroidia bacterium]
MKKSLITFVLIASACFSAAQTNALFIRVSSAVSAQTGKPLDGKLIALSVWSAENSASRMLNTEFDKAAKVYEYAKLKGGHNGLTSVTFSADRDKVLVSVTLKKDGISKLVSFTSDDKELAKLLEDKQPGYNIIFDKDGKVVYENLKEGTVFSSVNQLITR